MITSRRGFLRASLSVSAMGLALPHLSPHTPAGAPAPRTVREKVGQLFIVSFRGLTPDPSFLALLKRHAFGGVILYGRNCQSAPQVKTMVARLQHAAPFPLLIAADQEGGQVIRIRNGVHTFPSEATYGRIGSASRVATDAATTARDLRALGLSVNLAPVVDVLSNPASPIGDRSYGSDPALVARLSAAAIAAYQQHGMAAAAKHFIGLGHTSIDTHQALPTVTQSLSLLERDDLVPFRAALAANVSIVVVAHVALPALDPVHRPASLSPPVIRGYLRARLGFHGVVMTDSLAMGALPTGGTADAAVQALAAGADALLLAANFDIPAGVFDQAVDHVVSAVESGRIPRTRLDSAVARMLALKRRYAIT